MTDLENIVREATSRKQNRLFERLIQAVLNRPKPEVHNNVNVNPAKVEVGAPDVQVAPVIDVHVPATEPVEWRFEFIRDNRGLIRTIIAKPE
jgi:hypothetical protein